MVLHVVLHTCVFEPCVMFSWSLLKPFRNLCLIFVWTWLTLFWNLVYVFFWTFSTCFCLDPEEFCTSKNFGLLAAHTHLYFKKFRTFREVPKSPKSLKYTGRGRPKVRTFLKYKGRVRRDGRISLSTNSSGVQAKTSRTCSEKRPHKVSKKGQQSSNKDQAQAPERLE